MPRDHGGLSNADYAPLAEFDPYQIRPAALDRLFAELVEHAHNVPG